MAGNKIRGGPLILRGETDRVIAPAEIGAVVRNFVHTNGDTLRSVVGPTPFVPDYGTVYEPPTVNNATMGAGYGSVSVNQPAVTLGGILYTDAGQSFRAMDVSNVRGIFHAVVNAREIYLAHVDNEIWWYNGWVRSWRVLIGPKERVDTVDHPKYVATDIPNNDWAEFPTQFEATPAGVVIVPQGGRAYFFDGVVVAPLGYTQMPAAPSGKGPVTENTDANNAPIVEQGVIYNTVLDGSTVVTRHAVDASSINHLKRGPWHTGSFTTAALVDTDFDRNRSQVNQGGYAHDGQYGLVSGMPAHFGTGQLGTVEVPQGSSSVRGRLKAGRYQAAVAWLDRWGNISPLSARSAPVAWQNQISAYYQGVPGFAMANAQGETAYADIDSGCNINYNYARDVGQKPAPADLALKQVLWAGLSPGPEGTIGRILYRTTDMLNSGTTRLFEVPAAGSAISGVASIDDNITDMYPDNHPDSALLLEAPDIVPVPQFKLCTVAFGRLWVANTLSEPGIVRASMPGRWGTFERLEFIYPDPRGQDITGLAQVDRGVLAFTASTTFVIVENDEGSGFRSAPVSTTVGCVAPNSIKTLPDGRVVWLARDGFYSFDGTDVSIISVEIQTKVDLISPIRAGGACAAVDTVGGEYRCWVPIPGYEGVIDALNASTQARDALAESIEARTFRTNTVCFAYDGANWRERTDVALVSDVCTTQNGQGLMLVAGTCLGRSVHDDHRKDWFRYNGIWVLDREAFSFTPRRGEYSIETGWLLGASGQDRVSARRVYFWFRETGNHTPTVRIYRDWRYTEVHSTTTITHSTEDPPPFWNTAKFGESAAVWRRRRPFWTRVAVDVPSCESFKIELVLTPEAEGRLSDSTATFEGRSNASYPVKSVVAGVVVEEQEAGEGQLSETDSVTLPTISGFDIEFLGITFDVTPQGTTGARVPE